MAEAEHRERPHLAVRLPVDPWVLQRAGWSGFHPQYRLLESDPNGRFDLRLRSSQREPRTESSLHSRRDSLSNQSAAEFRQEPCQTWSMRAKAIRCRYRNTAGRNLRPACQPRGTHRGLAIFSMPFTSIFEYWAVKCSAGNSSAHSRKAAIAPAGCAATLPWPPVAHPFLPS